MPTVRQTIYSFVTLNPDCSSNDIADHIGHDLSYTSKTIHTMKLAGMLTSDKLPGTTAHAWRVTNRAVKFNTGETVRKQGKRKSSQMASIRLELSDLKKMIARLEKSLA